MVTKLYFGDQAVGGDVEQADLDALQAQIDGNADAITEITDTDIPDLQQQIDDNKQGIQDNADAIVLNTGAIEGNTNAIDILTNASVVGIWTLASGATAGTGEIALDNNDWELATKLTISSTDSTGMNFTFAQVAVKDVVQLGMDSGKGIFEIDAVNGPGDYDVHVLAATATHDAGAPVKVAFSSEYDESAMLALIAGNASDISDLDARVTINESHISVNEGDIADLKSDVSDNAALIAQIQGDLGDKFDKGSGTLEYLDAVAMGAAVKKNADDILNLSTGGNPAVDALEVEAVRNKNLEGQASGAVAGVMHIEVVTALPGSPDANTLYVVTG